MNFSCLSVFPRREPRVGSELEVASILKPLLGPRQSTLQVSGCFASVEPPAAGSRANQAVISERGWILWSGSWASWGRAVITGSRSLSAGTEGKRR